jgi:hypothetical protein
MGSTGSLTPRLTERGQRVECISPVGIGLRCRVEKSVVVVDGVRFVARFSISLCDTELTLERPTGYGGLLFGGVDREDEVRERGSDISAIREDEAEAISPSWPRVVPRECPSPFGHGGSKVVLSS